MNNFLSPIGCVGETTDVFFIVPNPDEENFLKGKPVSQKDLKFLHEIIKDTKCNFKFKIINNSPKLYFNPNKTERPANKIEIKNHKDELLSLVEKYNPKVIVACGKTTIEGLFNESYKTGIEKFRSKFKEIKIIGCPSLSYKGKNRKMESDLYDKTVKSIKYAKTIALGDDYRDIETNLDFEIIDAFNPSEVKKLEAIFDEDEKLVLDYEASGFDTYYKDFHLGGIGICTVDRKKSVYVYFYDFWRSVKDVGKVPDETLEILNKFFKDHKWIVFNMAYECAVTVSPAVGIEVNLDDLEDVLLYLRCLARSKSLKQSCHEELNIPKWTDAVETWIESVQLLFNFQKATASMKGQREEIHWMEEEGIDNYFDQVDYFKEKIYLEMLREVKRLVKKKPKVLDESQGVITEELVEQLVSPLKEFGEENQTRLNARSQKEDLISGLKELNLPSFKVLRKLFLSNRENDVIEATEKLKKLCSSYYPDEMERFGARFKSYMLGLLYNVQDFDYPSYADIPLKIVSKYCALDINYTAALYSWIMEELERKKLVEAAKYYMNHGYLGYILSRNGIAWNDELAAQLEKDYEKIALESLRSLILVPSMKKILRLNAQASLKVQSTYDREVLKSFFNPMSSHKYEGEDRHKTTTVRMTQAICTDRLKFAHILYEVYLHSCNLENPDHTKKDYPNLYEAYLEIKEKETIPEKIAYLEGLMRNRDLIERIKDRVIQNQDKNDKKTKEFDLVKQYANWTITSLDQENVQHIYGIFNTIIGIDPDVKDHWIPEWEAFYYFKVYKKVLKSLDTYINGSCGRKSVEIIREEDAKLDSPLRIMKYKRDTELPGTCIVNTGWGVCTAITKRWQAAQHTVPSSTELMDLRTTRFANGIKLHFDYGQAEVRVLAKLSNDKNLLKAFEEGYDPHKYSASIMWKKPIDEVSGEERRAAKAVTFSLLYGKSISEFANDITNGDIPKAQKIFDDFFAAYPDLKKFIDKMHIQGIMNDWVPSLFGDPIPVQTPPWFYDLKGDDQIQLLENPFNYDIELGKALTREEDRKERSKLSKAKRNSQNYCIQNSSSMLAGLCMYEIQREIEKMKLSCKLECFTHDSCDMDLEATDLIEVLDFLPDLALGYPEKQFDIPMAIDFEVGVSNNKMVELHEVKREGQKLTAGFSGKEESLSFLLEKLQQSGIKLEYSIEKEKEEMSSIEEIFVTKRAYASALGVPYKKVSGELTLEF